MSFLISWVKTTFFVVTGSLTSVPEGQAELLFHGTSAPIVVCKLHNLLPQPPNIPQHTLFLQQEVDTIIQNLRIGKAPGRDEITNQAIQAGGPQLAEAICCIANSCLKSGTFPSVLKVAWTAILRKPHKPDYTNPTAYQPIALLSCLGKVVEAVIALRFKNQADSRGILPTGHYGGRQQRLTEDALTHLRAWTKNQCSK